MTTPTAPDTAPSNNTRRFSDAARTAPPSPTLIGLGCHFEGQLHCAGDLTITGSGQGTITVAGTTLLSAGAQWHGTLHCAQAVIAGTFTGQIHATGSVEVRSSARIVGELHAGKLAIAHGAVIAADVDVPRSAIQHFTPKRADD